MGHHVHVFVSKCSNSGTMNRHACTKLLQDPNYIFCSSRKAIFWSYLVLFNNNQCELIIIIKAHINKPMMNDSQQPSENDLERAIDFEDNNNPQLIQIIKNAKFLCKKGSNVDNDQKLKNIIELNKHIKEIEHQRKLIEYIQKDELIIVIRDLLLDRDLKTRQEACKCLRRLINKSTIMIDKYKQYKIHFLISRNIEKDIKTKGSGTKSVEAIECSFDPGLKLIKKWIMISPKTFPLCLSKNLTTLANYSDESTKKASLEIVRLLAVSNTEICQYGGGIKILCDAIVDPAFESASASKYMMNTIIYLLNSPETRDHIIDHLQIPKIFSYFTDIDRNDAEKKKEDPGIFEARLRLASNAILTFFKSWPGLIYLGNEKYSLKSLVEALRQPIKPLIRDYIFQLLEEILKIGVSLCPQESESTTCTLRRSLAQHAYIQTTLLKEAGLYDILLELSSVDNPDISIKAQYQLKLFSHMMYHLLPLEEVKKPDFLMNSINLDETQFDYMRSKCSTIFENMNTKLIRRNTSKKIKNEFLYKCEHFYLNMPYAFTDTRINREVVEKLKIQDEGSIEEPKMNAYIKSFLNSKEWQKWNFQEILQILESINNNNQFQELCENHFFKKLIKFFQPSYHAFIDLTWKPDNFIYAKTGYVLIKILLKSSYGRKLLSQSSNENFFVVNKGFLAEIQSLLEQDQKYLKQIKTHLTSSSINLAKPSLQSPSTPTQASAGEQVLLNFESFNYSMLREFFSWIGLFTQTKQGIDLLGEQNIFETLKQFVKKSGSRDHLIRVVLFTMNYNFDQTKNLLVHCLLTGSPGLRISCLTVIKLLHKAEQSDLLSWVKEPVLKQINHKSDSVVDAALSTIDTLAFDDENLTKFFKDSRIVINKKTYPLLMKYLRTEEGFLYLEKNGWVEQQMKEWLESEKFKFVDNFDKRVIEYLDSSSGENTKYDYRYISFHSETDPVFAQSPIYINSLIRLPWNILLTLITGRGKIEKKMNIQVDYSWSEECLIIEGRTSELDAPELLKLALNVANSSSEKNWNLKATLRMGEVFLNNQCQQVENPYIMSCDHYSQPNIKANEFIPSQKHYEKNNIEIIFYEETDSQYVKSIGITIKVKLSDNNKSTATFSHFFGCLSKTGYGVDYLRKNEIAENLFKDLKNPEAKLNQKRADLWALGHIGQSEFGMSYLINSGDLVKHVLDLANNSDHLLLKGVCLHVANMFSQQNAGREFLKELNWEVNLLKKNDHSDSESEFICLPSVIKSFLSIPKRGKVESFQQKSFYWDKYTDLLYKIKEKIKDNQKAIEFFELITKIPNRFITTKPINITEFLQNKTDMQIYKNTKLFYLILMMLTFYNFPIGVRKNYYMVMDHFLNVPNFLILLDEDHDFEDLLKI